MARPQQEKRVLTYRDPDYAKHDPFSNYRSGVITGASSSDEDDGSEVILDSEDHEASSWYVAQDPSGTLTPERSVRESDLESAFDWDDGVRIF